ncbi:hypothetical protein MBLNU230_g0669t1 [Neophaeotheca triangularis]
MKTTSIVLLSAAIACAGAHPHNHGHQHHHVKRIPTPVDVVQVAGPTVVVYELNGQAISAEDVQNGIANGTLVWANGAVMDKAEYDSSTEQQQQAASTQAPPAYTHPSSSAESEYVAAPPTTLSTQAAPTTSEEPTSEYVAPTSTAQSAVESSSPAEAPSGSYSGGSSSGSSSGWSHDDASGLDREFPDGEINCSTFPSEYGALAVPWAGLGGWTGIQSPGTRHKRDLLSNAVEKLSGYANIRTATSGTCSGEDCCTEGSYCSYACPAGYQKTQWPTTQGATGQSVGGVQCKNGKLTLTNPSLSKSLCMRGTDQVKVVVENRLSGNSAVCRTDYPGTEAETVPVDTTPGSTTELACPDGDNYYVWEGGMTSAQYYVNPMDVAVQDACQWGSPAQPWGNWAPVNLGVGYSAGSAWLSIFQNAPTTDEKLEFSVELQGDDMNGKCRYQNGQYCSGENYENCNTKEGCTVAVRSGTAKFIFS